MADCKQAVNQGQQSILVVDQRIDEIRQQIYNVTTKTS